MGVQFATVKRQRRAREQLLVEARQQRHQTGLVRCGHHQHAATVGRWKVAVVQIVAVQGDQCAAQLAREFVVLGIAGTTQVGMIHHEQNIPMQLLPHVADHARWQVGIGIHQGQA